MDPLAQALNDRITAVNPHVYAMLSDLGKRIYFPSKGILSQSGEAKKLAKTYNATIGTAMEGGKAMHLACLMQQLPGLSPDDALLYAPSPGLPALREAWRDKMLRDNPGLQGTTFSLPIVTTGLSHGLSVVADLLIDADDLVLMPDMNWDNYHLNFVVRKGAETCLFPFFKDGGFDVGGFVEALQKYSAGRDKLVVLLNFPNNPSGYTVTESEGEAIAAAL
ncbi:MAG TPA: aminotransferase class I/II-fold pyridoxal phosphate-dependent enzyme, partial [Lentisphaeria bacterium]|nr:aminotransferase class I/II-fold pyridoxal phosphate-dependent enzyme [Lentisphaeria bacterium]